MVRPIPIKTKPVQEQLSQKQADTLIELFEKDLETLFEFVNRLNLYEMATINDYSEEREKFSIAEWIKESKIMIKKGFTHITAKSGVQLVDDIARWSVRLLAPTLTELVNKLDKINQIIQTRAEEVETIKEEKKEIEVEAQKIMDMNDKLEEENETMLQIINENITIIEKLITGKTIKEIEKEKDFKDKIEIFYKAKEINEQKNQNEKIVEEEEKIEINEPLKKTQTKYANGPSVI